MISLFGQYYFVDDMDDSVSAFDVILDLEQSLLI